MKLPSHAVHFAGKTEYLRDLETLRQRLAPLQDMLEDKMKCEHLTRSLENSERQVEEARRRAEEEGGFSARFRLGSARMSHLFQKGVTLGNALVMAFRGTLETPDEHDLVRAEARDPEAAERLKRELAERASMLSRLRDVVEQLRREPAPDSEKDQWVREFESKTQQPLNEVEQYILKEWNG